MHLLTLAAWTLGLLHRGGLAATYAATVVALALLYPLCDRYRAYKQAHPDGLAEVRLRDHEAAHRSTGGRRARNCIRSRKS